MEPFEESIDKGLFKETESQDKNFLFKLAANNFISNETDNSSFVFGQLGPFSKNQIQETSLRYQVLSKHTEMVGISKINQTHSAQKNEKPKRLNFGGPVQM